VNDERSTTTVNGGVRDGGDGSEGHNLDDDDNDDAAAAVTDVHHTPDTAQTGQNDRRSNHSSQNDDNPTVSSNHPEIYVQLSSASTYHEESLSVPVAHLVPITEENDEDGTAMGGGTLTPTPMLRILGTPYIEEGPRIQHPSTGGRQPRHSHPQSHQSKTLRQHIQQNKAHYCFLTLVISLVLSAGLFGLICGISGSCSKTKSYRKNTTDTNHTGGTDTETNPPPPRDQRTIDLMNYINTITLSNRTIRYPPPSLVDLGDSSNTDNDGPDVTTITTTATTIPAEELALQWLIEIDPLQLSVDRTEHLLSIRQRYALQTLYMATSTTGQWTNSSGGWIQQKSWSATESITSNHTMLHNDECQWFGVSCSPIRIEDSNSTANVVTSLRLNDNGLHGSIPPDLGLLTSLTYMDVSYNVLCGPIPSTIGQWQFIEYLDLHVDLDTHRECLLNGSIPSTIGNWKGPKIIDWSGHALSGAFPLSMSHWDVHRIQKFNMNWNQIDGTIPSFIVLWSNLISIEMMYNHITGTIPELLGNLNQLQHFNFLGNSLNGTLPSTLSNLSHVEFFSVGENMLTGTIPTDIAWSWTNLRYAGFYRNHFIDGTISEDICHHQNHSTTTTNATTNHNSNNNNIHIQTTPTNDDTTTTNRWLWVEIDCNNTVTEDICSCCDCIV
jgi:hypothetical protein